MTPAVIEFVEVKLPSRNVAKSKFVVSRKRSSQRGHSIACCLPAVHTTLQYPLLPRTGCGSTSFKVGVGYPAGQQRSPNPRLACPQNSGKQRQINHGGGTPARLRAADRCPERFSLFAWFFQFFQFFEFFHFRPHCEFNVWGRTRHGDKK